MRVFKKAVLTYEESDLFNKFTMLLRKLQDELEGENMDDLLENISNLETQVADVWDDFDAE